ncbi:MAG: right-handed parallel beta-helix repeat-containing protein [Myxococcales bacterium]|nr:right-handed parallel beta-helix repeat-containing protein [Myxococcales bacterium]
MLWSPADGVIRVTGDVLVPAGESLLVEAGTLVMLDAGARITVEGTLLAEGTEMEPIFLFAADSGDAATWAQIEIRGSGNASLVETLVSGGGDTPTLGHCCGPAIHVDGGTLTMTRSVLTNSIGKGLYASDAAVTLRDTQFAHLKMGAEFSSGVTRIADSHFFDFAGDDDSDGLYFRLGGDATVDTTVVAHGDDDGIDTLVSSPILRKVVVHDIADKCVSINGGNAEILDSLLVRCDIGVAIKDRVSEADTRPTIAGTTIAHNTTHGISIANVTASAVVRPDFDRIVVWGSPDSLTTEYSLDDITLDYSSLEHLVTTPGEGNISSDPEFISANSYEYRPNPDSATMRAGPSGEAIGWTGWWQPR